MRIYELVLNITFQKNDGIIIKKILKENLTMASTENNSTFYLQKNQLETNITQKENELTQLTTTIKSLFSEIDTLTSDLVSVLAFGKQQTRIAKTKEEIEIKNMQLFDLLQTKEDCLKELEHLGMVHHRLHNEEKMRKENERKLRDVVVQTITHAEQEIHQQFNQLVKLKSELLEGRLSINDIMKDNKIVIGKMEIRMDRVMNGEMLNV